MKFKTGDKVVFIKDVARCSGHGVDAASVLSRYVRTVASCNDQFFSLATIYDVNDYDHDTSSTNMKRNIFGQSCGINVLDSFSDTNVVIHFSPTAFNKMLEQAHAIFKGRNALDQFEYLTKMQESKREKLERKVEKLEKKIKKANEKLADVRRLLADM